jgi:hypothetical protein
MSLIGRMNARSARGAAASPVGREMREEMGAHIEQATARLMAGGLSERDAAQAARREFGQLGVLQEQGRDARGGRWVGILASDVRYAFRYFSRTKLVTITSVLILTVGVIVNAAMFTFADASFNRPAPGVPDDPALVLIRGEGLFQGRRISRALPFMEMAAYAALHDTFESVAGWTTDHVIVDVGNVEGGPASARVQFVTPNFFQALGARLATGPGFVQSRFDEHTVLELSAVVSHTFADEKFGGVANAVGKQFRLNGFVVRIVGVAPPRFNGPFPNDLRRVFWMPLSAWRTVMALKDDPFASATGQYFHAFARLRSGVSRASAQTAVNAASLRAIAEIETAGGMVTHPGFSDRITPRTPTVVRLLG